MAPPPKHNRTLTADRRASAFKPQPCKQLLIPHHVRISSGQQLLAVKSNWRQPKTQRLTSSLILRDRRKERVAAMRKPARRRSCERNRTGNTPCRDGVPGTLNELIDGTSRCSVDSRACATARAVFTVSPCQHAAQHTSKASRQHPSVEAVLVRALGDDSAVSTQATYPGMVLLVHPASFIAAPGRA